MSANRTGRASSRMFTDINITPLTDIFLVLLIIMMVIAPMLDSKGLKLAVPAVGTAAPNAGEAKTLTLQISASGTYTLDNQPVDSSLLQSSLAKGKASHPDGLVIQTDPNALHGAVVQAMDAARQAGIEKIGVAQAQ